jgi:hypothetical protein
MIGLCTNCIDHEMLMYNALKWCMDRNNVAFRLGDAAI